MVAGFDEDKFPKLNGLAGGSVVLDSVAVEPEFAGVNFVKFPKVKVDDVDVAGFVAVEVDDIEEVDNALPDVNDDDFGEASVDFSSFVAPSLFSVEDPTEFAVVFLSFSSSSSLMNRS